MSDGEGPLKDAKPLLVKELETFLGEATKVVEMELAKIQKQAEDLKNVIDLMEKSKKP